MDMMNKYIDSLKQEATKIRLKISLLEDEIKELKEKLCKQQ